MQRHFQTMALGANKRQRTRGCLLDSAIDVLAKQGINNAKISDITAQAGLANGTFYNHFKDKEQLVAQTAIAIAVELSKQLDDAMQGLDDAILRIVVASTLFIGQAVQYPQWGVVLLESYHTLPMVRSDVPQYLLSDIERGIKQNKFTVCADNFLLEQVIALLMACLRSQLEFGFEQAKTNRLCQHILRLLGLTPQQASAAIEQAQCWRQ